MFIYIYTPSCSVQLLRAVISHVVMALVVRASTDPSWGITEKMGKSSRENPMDSPCIKTTQQETGWQRPFFEDLYVFVYS